MADDTPDDPASSPESSRPRRAGPTIDLEPSEVTETSAGASGEGGASRGRAGGRFASLPRPSMAAWGGLSTAAATGAVAALLVIACAWALGWLGESVQPVAQAQVNASEIEALSARVSTLEARPSQSASPDPQLAAKLDAVEKSVASLRSELSGERARLDKLASQLDAGKSAPSLLVTSPDLSAIEDRLAKLERMTRADSEKIAQNAQKPADDTALRRLVVASMLNLSVRQSEPFTSTLDAAKALAADPDSLKPLATFAASGVPNPAALTRELLNLVPKLTPPAPANTTGAGILDRLQAGASKLVRVERTDATGNDRGAIVARITAAAVRNDLPEARRELEQLSAEDRKPAQGWLDKVKERDAALAATHQFVNEAMAALARPVP